MATFAATFHPSQESLSGSIAAGADSGEVVIGIGRIFAINATQDVMIRFGNSGLGASSAANFRLVANSYSQFDMGTGLDRIRLFNSSGTSIASYYIQYLVKS